MDINAKYRPFYIAKLLEELTDEDHYLTTAQISDLLEERYGMTSYRTTITQDIEVLKHVGMEIDCIPSTQNRYRLLSRRFDDGEIRLLIEAVKDSRSINAESKELLIAKLAKEAGSFKADSLKEGFVKKNHNKVSQLRGKQQETYDYLCEEVRTKGYPPTVREICDHFGLTSTSSAYGRLFSLEKNGLIRRDPGKPRTIEICWKDDSNGAE